MKGMGLKRTLQSCMVTSAVIVGLCLVLLAILAALNRRNQAVGLNQEIQYDDFAFSVLGTRTATSLGTGESQANSVGAYYVVTMKVANHARRVDYTLDKAIAVLVDDEGREFHLSLDGQRALDSAREKRDECDAPLPAGASCVTEIVFELPAGARASYLRVSEGGPAGDILDTVFYGRKIIELW
jgi:Domain of unknown function (DUF4352)